ncbi:MAG: 50S ribosomal protein L21 [Clostridia bacterium]
MYAIIMTGGKQYKVAVGETVRVEKLDEAVDSIVDLSVLMLNDDGNVICGDAASKAVVKAQVLGQDKAKKIVVYKYKSKKNERKRQGHRQPFTVIKITEIIA